MRIYEHTKATKLEHDGIGVLVHTPFAKVRAGRVALGTNAFPPLLRRMRHYIVPGLRLRDGHRAPEPRAASPASGGPTARGSPTTPTSSTTTGSPRTTGSCGAATTPCTTSAARSTPPSSGGPRPFARLSQHFFTTFPQLEGVEFTNAWGGAIDTCTRFCVFWDTAMRGRVAYAAGYTGLGVCSTRFGAEVLSTCSRAAGPSAPTLEFVAQEAAPVPAGADQVRSASSRPAGRSTAPTAAAAIATLWLRMLDRLGLGFDS